MTPAAQQTVAAPTRVSSPVCYQNTLIVIPAFNEAKNIGAVLDDIRQELPEIPVLVINDGSSDATAQIARERGAKVISLPYNSGYGVALQTGFIYAHQKKYSVVVQMDGDRQHGTESIKNLLQEVQQEDVDVVIGSRFLGTCRYKSSLARKIGIFIFGKLASFLIGQDVTDPTSGFQAIKGDAIRFMASDFYPPDYPDADFIILLHRFGYKIREIPVIMRPNQDNKSMHRGHKTIYYIFKMFLSIIVTLLRQKPKKKT